MKTELPLPIKSSLPGLAWPALPADGSAASPLAVLFQLERTQWWSAEMLAQAQLRQLAPLLQHAAATVPYYREQFRRLGFDPARHALSEEIWQSLPCLTRDEIQAHGAALASTAPPPSHGRPFERSTSGSSGKPIRVRGSPLAQLFYGCITLRDHLWQRRDFAAKLAIIRTRIESALRPDWGAPTSAVFATGPSAQLNIQADIDAQIAWLVEQAPAYLLTHPSNLYAVARRCLETGTRLPGLRGLRTFGEMLKPDLRTLCRAAWDVGLADCYSAEEVGYLALQCPEHEHYHVQSEVARVEVLGDDGRPCVPGEIGQIVVTPLHNFAMPLLRYALLDRAEVGPACPCGRGLPVLKRIVGRQRNMLVFPDGRRHWPSFPAGPWLEIAPVRQFQLIQHARESIRVRLVVGEALTPAVEARLAAMLSEKLGYPFSFEFEYLDRIERKPNCKYEDFICELPEDEARP